MQPAPQVPRTMRLVKTHCSVFFNLSQPASKAVRLIIPHGTPGMLTRTDGARTLQETEPCRYGLNDSQMHVQMNVCFSCAFSSEPEHKSGIRSSVPARRPRGGRVAGVAGAWRAWRAWRARGARGGRVARARGPTRVRAVDAGAAARPPANLGPPRSACRARPLTSDKNNRETRQ